MDHNTKAKRFLQLGAILLILSRCDSSILSSPTEVNVNENLGVTSVYNGSLTIYPHKLGFVATWHVRTAETYWISVSECIGLDPNVPNGFPIMLIPDNNACDLGLGGCIGQGYIEIQGKSFDFDPYNPMANMHSNREFNNLWRHELLHLALQLKTGSADSEHVGPEWNRCAPWE